MYDKMIITKNLLKTFVDIPKDIYDITYNSMIEVEAFEPINVATKLVTGHVLTCVDHPDSDHLHVTTVDLGNRIEKIVCGAPNVAAGQYVIVAQVGTILPGNIEIKSSIIRGQASNGMICSLQELGFDDAQIPEAFKDGIYAFDHEVELGKSALEVLYLDGWKMTLGLTPNRADLLSTLGFAYDLAAMTNQTVREPVHHVTESDVQNPVKVKIASAGCGRYDARYIENIKIKESPWWLKSELIARGMNPINNVVDISNYVLLAYGTPLHMFDASKIKTNEIVIRDAKDGETVISLDGQKRVLKPEDVVITNGKEPIAIAGVMGLANTMIDNKTTSVILEAAYFEPKRIQKTSKRLDMKSDASLRFERGIDDCRVRMGLERATELLIALADATVRSGIATAIHHVIEHPNIHLKKDYLFKLLGETIEDSLLEHYFKRYRYQYKTVEGGYDIMPPSDRNDLKIPADLVEEIARIHGLNTIPAVQETTLTNGVLNAKQIRNRRVRHLLADMGLQEAISYSLVPESDAQLYQNLGETLTVLQPMSEDKKALRQSLLNGLLAAATYNHARQAEHIRLFELGHVFAKGIETEHLAMVISGIWQQNLWQKTSVPVDFFVLKGLLERLFAYLKVDVLFEASSDKDYLHPHRQAVIMYGKEVIGFMGQIHPKTAKLHDIDDAYLAEINLDKLPVSPPSLTYQPLTRFPSVSRDLALVVDENVKIGELMAIITQTVQKHLVSLDLFDVYQGEHIAAGKKSLAFRLVFNDEKQTLARETVDKLIKKVVSRLSNLFDATVRN